MVRRTADAGGVAHRQIQVPISRPVHEDQRPRKLPEQESADFGVGTQIEGPGPTDGEDDDRVEAILDRRTASPAPPTSRSRTLSRERRSRFSSSWSWQNLLWRAVTWPILVVFVAWLCLAAVAAAKYLLRRTIWAPQVEEIPLHYIVWSVGSNAVHTREVMQQMMPIKHFGREVFNKAE